MRQDALFKMLSSGLEETIRGDNPWWRGEKLFNLPRMKRSAFHLVSRGMKKGLTPAVVLRGPRQVGKTTLMEHVIASLLDETSRIKISPALR